MDNLFKKYQRKQIAELRPVNMEDMTNFQDFGDIPCGEGNIVVSISDVDRENGSPKYGDMIARNPNNYNDQWLVAKQYFEDNFEEV